MSDIQLTPRQQQVLQAIKAKPTATLQDIGSEIGVTRERVRQIANALHKKGVIDDRLALKKEAIQQDKEEQKATVTYRKRVWRRMMFIGLRMRLRHMARINHLGLVRDCHMPGQEVTCQFIGCTRFVVARGFCSRHYTELRHTGALWVCRRGRAYCKEPACGMTVYARDMCLCHYTQYRRKHPAKKLPAHNTSGYRGVSWSKKDRCWYAYINTGGAQKRRQEYLGSFETRELAARAYDTAARKYFGEDAKLNFPNEDVEVTKNARQKTSLYRGVCRYNQRWHVRITKNGKVVYLGSFINMEDAARAYDRAAHQHYGDKAKLNFPNEY